MLNRIEQIVNKPLIHITKMDDYLDVISDGHEPLFQWTKFYIDFQLRQYIQNSLFGKTALGNFDTVRANQRYYMWCWEHKLQVCLECGKPLDHYWSGFISHILSRGGYAPMAHDCRNSNILCGKCHPLVEKEQTHLDLKIYQTDQIIIKILKYEYQQN